MIVFDLACTCGFQFEGWFRDHEDFSAQGRAGLLQCPSCGGSAIRKLLSPEEEQVLKQEGIELLKLPVLPPEEGGSPQ